MRVIFNEDDNHYWYGRYGSHEPVDETALREFIREYRDSDVTDFSVNVNCSVSSTRSDVMQDFRDKYERREENGVPVDYRDTYYRYLFDLWQQGIDPYAVWFEEIRNCHMRPWISFRMNDCHCFMEAKAHWVKSELIERKPEWWVCRGRKPARYFDKCLNYRIPEVRQYFLDYLTEQISRYDVDGVELDFGREPYCFPVGQEEKGRQVMLDFLGEVRALTDRVGRERGKKLEIRMLCQTNPITAYQCGFDLQEAVNRGYLDEVVPGARWATINTDVPLEIWRKLLGDKVQLGAVQQELVTPHPYPSNKGMCADLEMSYGQAAAFTARGADFLYLYNLMDHCIAPEEESRYHPNAGTRKWNTIIHTIGHEGEQDRWNRRCPLTYDDFAGLCDPKAVRFPLDLKPGAVEGFRVSTGRIRPGQKAYVNFETSEPMDPKIFTVTVNDAPAVLSPETKEDPYIIRQNPCTFAFTADTETMVSVEVTSEAPCRLEYLEIYICGMKE